MVRSMIYVVVPLVVTFVMVGRMWEEFARDRTQESFNAAMTATFHCVLATSATSFTLWMTK